MLTASDTSLHRDQHAAACEGQSKCSHVRTAHEGLVVYCRVQTIALANNLFTTHAKDLLNGVVLARVCLLEPLLQLGRVDNIPHVAVHLQALHKLFFGQISLRRLPVFVGLHVHLLEEDLCQHQSITVGSNNQSVQQPSDQASDPRIVIPLFDGQLGPRPQTQSHPACVRVYILSRRGVVTPHNPAALVRAGSICSINIECVIARVAGAATVPPINPLEDACHYCYYSLVTLIINGPGAAPGFIIREEFPADIGGIFPLGTPYNKSPCVKVDGQDLL
eukprot:881225-Pyramimonas_sp.AAC.1